MSSPRGDDRGRKRRLARGTATREVGSRRGEIDIRATGGVPFLRPADLAADDTPDYPSWPCRCQSPRLRTGTPSVRRCLPMRRRRIHDRGITTIFWNPRAGCCVIGRNGDAPARSRPTILEGVDVARPHTDPIPTRTLQRRGASPCLTSSATTRTKAGRPATQLRARSQMSPTRRRSPQSKSSVTSPRVARCSSSESATAAWRPARGVGTPSRRHRLLAARDSTSSPPIRSAAGSTRRSRT